MKESIQLIGLAGPVGESRRKTGGETVFNKYFDTLKTSIKKGDTASLKNQLELPEYRNVVDFTDSEGYSLIHIASQESDPTSIKYLIDAGARPNVQDSKGRTALHVVVSGGKTNKNNIF